MMVIVGVIMITFRYYRGFLMIILMMMTMIDANVNDDDNGRYDNDYF